MSLRNAIVFLLVREGEKRMYFMRKSTIIYRDFGEFGYITDNRNFEYKMLNDNRECIGDRVISKSGKIFLFVLKNEPLSLSTISEKICEYFMDANKETIKKDAMEFYRELEEEGFIVSGKTMDECIKKDSQFWNKDCFKDSQMVKKENTEKKDNSTQDFMEKYFGYKPQLTNIHMEITSRCNERCVHCYIPHELKISEMSSDVFYDILAQAREMQVLHLTISGGEPMLHPCFVDFLKKSKEYNFSVNILSNLTLLNDVILNEIKNNPLICIQTSIYSMNPDIHDEITQEKGSLNKTVEAILKLIENKIPVQISCPILQQNKECYNDVVNWGRAHNINVNSDFVIIGQFDHANKNLNCRLSVGDIEKYINYKMNNDSQYLSFIEKEKVKKKDLRPDDYICSVCNSSICISEKGDVYPCAGWQDYVLGNINTTKLEHIWYNSSRANYLRNLRRRDFPKCLGCSQKEFCTMCMVRNANEDLEGNPLHVNPFFCEIARISKQLYNEIKD